MKQTTQQQFSSADTSLCQVPALHKAFVRLVRKAGGEFMGDAVVDFGAGKYDAAGDFIRAELGCEYYPQDRYNRTPEENERAYWAAIETNCVGLCANVLNVIAEPEARAELIMAMANTVNGPCLFSVYEGDGSGVGRQTTKGYQNNRKLATYIDELRVAFDTVERKGAVLICTSERGRPVR